MALLFYISSVLLFPSCGKISSRGFATHPFRCISFSFLNLNILICHCYSPCSVYFLFLSVPKYPHIALLFSLFVPSCAKIYSYGFCYYPSILVNFHFFCVPKYPYMTLLLTLFSLFPFPYCTKIYPYGFCYYAPFSVYFHFFPVAKYPYMTLLLTLFGVFPLPSS